jgi:hypothetical protein
MVGHTGTWGRASSWRHVIDLQEADKLFLASMRCRLSDRAFLERRESCKKEANVDDAEERTCLSPGTRLRRQQHCINVMRMRAKTLIVFLFQLSSQAQRRIPALILPKTRPT